MKTISTAETARTMDIRWGEVVWLLDPPQRYRGAEGLFEILQKAHGVGGVYSGQWLLQNCKRVGIQSVLDLITEDKPELHIGRRELARSF